MLLNKLIILLLFIFSTQIWALNCDLAKMMNQHPKLAQNSEFWTKMSTINSKDEQAVRKLIAEFAPEALESTHVVVSSTVAASESAVEISHKVEKAVIRLTKINAKHYDDFTKILNEKGVQGFYENPGKWHYEKLPQYGPNAHSVRLDGGVRVLLDVGKNGATVVRDISNKIGH